MGIFGGGGGSSGGTVNNVAGAAQYVPADQGGADQALQNLFNSLNAQPNYPAQNLPAITGDVNALTSSPYAPGAQTAANNEGTILSGLSGQDLAAGQSLQPYAAQTLNTAFDPQNALFNQQSQQLQDQVNATNSMYGLGSSPVGASILDNQLQNFDLNWQNQQLARQATGASTAEGLLSGGANLGGQAAAAAGQAGSVPQAAYVGNISNNLSALSGLNQAGQSTQNMPISIANILQSYLDLGQTANVNEANAQQAGFNNLAAGANGIVQGAGALNGLGSIFGGGSGAATGFGAAGGATGNALEASGFGVPADAFASSAAAGSSGGIGDFLASVGLS